MPRSWPTTSSEIGIPALDVIRWATKHGAELMGRADELGTVEVGKLADLLVVDGDPLADITVLAGPGQPVGHHQGRPMVKDDLVGQPFPPEQSHPLVLNRIPPSDTGGPHPRRRTPGFGDHPGRPRRGLPRLTR